MPKVDSINLPTNDENKSARVTAVIKPIIPTSFLTNPSLNPSKKPIAIATIIIISMKFNIKPNNFLLLI